MDLFERVTRRVADLRAEGVDHDMIRYAIDHAQVVPGQDEHLHSIYRALGALEVEAAR